MAGTGFTGGLRGMVLMQRRARRAALSGCRCRDPLFGGLPGRRPRASELSPGSTAVQQVQQYSQYSSTVSTAYTGR